MNASSVTPRGTHRWCCKFIAVLTLQAAALAGAAATSDDRMVQAGWDAPSWRPARAGLTLAVNQAARPDGGRLAVFVDATEVTALLRTTGSELVYPADAPPLPAGERRIKVFIASADESWQAVAEFPSKILARGGFVVAEAKPTVDLTGKARLDLSFEPAEQAPTDEASRAGTGGYASGGRRASYAGASRRSTSMAHRWPPPNGWRSLSPPRRADLGSCCLRGAGEGGAPVAPLVQQMADGQVGVAPEHARAGPAHHLAHALPFGGAVTVDGARHTGWLVGLKRAAVEAVVGVRQQSGALRA